MRRTITDTADRLRPTDTLTVNGKPLLVIDITNAPTSIRPARLALTVCDPHGSLADLNAGQVLHLDAGEIVTFQPGSMHLADATGRRPGDPEAANRSFAPTIPQPYALFTNERIEQRRCELAAERAAGPTLDNDYFQAMLADLHR